MLLSSCKKQSESGPDYNCNCQSYGKNVLSLLIHGSMDLYPYETDKHRWGFIDQNGAVIIGANYASAYLFSNNRAMVIDDKNGVQFAGFVDANGSMVITPQYRLVTGGCFSAEGLVPIGDVKKWVIGYIEMNGQVRVPFQYAWGGDFSEGFAIVGLANKYGAIDIQGNLVVPVKYDALSDFSEGLALAFNYGEKPGYITPSDHFKFKGDFVNGTVFMYGRAAVCDASSQLIGFIDNTGCFVIPPKYSEAFVFSEGLAAVEYKGKWGFIDPQGNTIIAPEFDDVSVGFCNGLAPVEKNGAWGYIDHKGTFVISPQFDEADVFYCNLAMVKFRDATSGYVNKSGDIVYRSTHPFLRNVNTPNVAKSLSKFNIRVEGKQVD